MSPVLLHSLHVAVLAVPALIVVAVVLRGRRTARSADRLRAAIASGNLVALAEARAGRILATPRLHPAARVFAPATAAAGVVHGAVCPEHFAEGLRFGLFFLALSATQCTVAVAVVLGRRTTAPLATGALASGGAVILWLLTRTVGLPFHLAEVEPVGLWDTAASVAEVVACAAAVVALRGALPARRPLRAAVGA